jgi:hypothetical protein
LFPPRMPCRSVQLLRTHRTLERPLLHNFRNDPTDEPLADRRGYMEQFRQGIGLVSVFHIRSLVLFCGLQSTNKGLSSIEPSQGEQNFKDYLKIVYEDLQILALDLPEKLRSDFGYKETQSCGSVYKC